MPRTTTNDQIVVTGSTLAGDFLVTTELTTAVSGDVTSIAIQNTDGFPTSGTFVIGGATSVNYTGRSGNTLTFSTTSLTFPIGAKVTIATARTYTSPISAISDDSPEAFDEYVFTHSNETDGNTGALRFESGANCVIGSPNVDSTVNYGTVNSLTATNGPYRFNTTKTWASAATISSTIQGLAAKLEFDFPDPLSGLQILGIGGNNALASQASNSDAWVVCTSGTPSGTQRIWSGRFSNFIDTSPVSNGTSEIHVRSSADGGSETVNADNAVAGWDAMSSDPNNPTVVNQRGSSTEVFQAYRNFTATNESGILTFTRNTAGSVPTPTNFILGSGSVSFTDGNDIVSFTITGTSSGLSNGDFVATDINGSNETTITSLDTSSGNTVIMLEDTTGWTGTSAVFKGTESITGTWGVNPNSVVPLNSSGGVDIQNRTTLRLTGGYDGDDTGSPVRTNYTMFSSDSIDCRPILYGVDIKMDSTQPTTASNRGFMNLVGQANNQFNASADGRSTVQFHDCSVAVTASSNFRFSGFNYLINGLSYVTYAPSGAFEFPQVPLFTPQGLSLAAPNINDTRFRAFLFFCNQGTTDDAATRALRTHTFENPSAPNYCAYNGSSRAFADLSVGATVINGTDCAPVPFAASTIDNSSPTKTLPLGSTGIDINGRDMMSNTVLFTQRYRITLPGSTAWTVRVIKSSTSSALWDSSQQATNVAWQGRTRSIAGLVTTGADTTFNTTTEYFPTAVQVADPTTQETSTGRRNLRVLDTSSVTGKLQTNDVPIYFGYDGLSTIRDVEGENVNRIDLVLPTHSNASTLDTGAAKRG